MMSDTTDTIRLVALYGLGDSYLVCALAAGVKAHYRKPVVVVLKESHLPIAKLFGEDFPVATVPDAEIKQIEEDPGFWASYDNRIDSGRSFYVHPHFTRTTMRIDHLALKPTVTHADLFRVILGLPPDAALTPAKPTLSGSSVGKTALVCRTASSWPNTTSEFWAALEKRLIDDGWRITLDDKSLSIVERLLNCQQAEWVIGPQFGLMAVICAAQFPCRKTFCTPSIDGDGNYPGLPLKRTFPYAYVTKFMGCDYDIEEYKFNADNFHAVVQAVASSKNALRLGAHNPAPVFSIPMDVAPGDFFDRLSILAIKMKRLSPEKAARVSREYYRMLDTAEPIFGRHGVSLHDAYGRLMAANAEVFSANDLKVIASQNGDVSQSHMHADVASLRRMRIKQEINQLCGSVFDEIKSYEDWEGDRK